MKLTGILLVAAFLQVSAGSTAQRLSISVRNGSLEKVFSEIEKKTTYVFFYDATLLRRATPVTVEMKDASVEEVLKVTLKGQGLEFEIQDKTIFLKREAGGAAPHAPPAEVGGGGDGPVAVVVQSEAGVPVAGATVTIKQLKKQGMTDAKGEFLLKGIADGEYLVEVTSVGYERYTTMLKVVNGEARMSVSMKQATNRLDEMVVKGYYTTTNRLNTGDVTTVKGEDIQKQPVSDPILALEGRVPGLVIQQSSGIPGAYSKIQIRGQNSIANGNDPLYIIDGVPFSSVSLSSSSINLSAVGFGGGLSNSTGGGLSPFNALNPQDIESIVVLKDADATAIYGSRGANGVILITTRKGKAGDLRFNLNAYSGVGNVAHQLRLLNTPQYLRMRREAFLNDSLPFPSIQNDPYNTDYDVNGVWDTTRHTNWQKALIGNTANFTNAQAEITGGGDNTQFAVGGGFSKQGTVFPGSYSDQKVSGRISLTNSSNDHRFGSQFLASYTNDINQLPPGDFTSGITLAPDAPAMYDNKGNINWQVYNGTSTFFVNPVAQIPNISKAVTNNLISNLSLHYDLFPGLQIKTSLGYNHDQLSQTTLTLSTSYGPPYNTDPTNRSNAWSTTEFSCWIVEPQVNYHRQIALGKLEVLFGSTFQQNTSHSLSQYAYNFVSDALVTNPQAAAVSQIAGASDVLYRYNSFYGRIGYNWQDKYIFNFTGRRDGSSRFGPGKQFGNFGSAAAAWIFSKEDFFKRHIPFVSLGKIRGSYGIVGNDQISDYQWLSTYSSNSSTYQGISNLRPTRLTNPFFAWEVNKKLEAGIDIGVLQDRITFSVSYYRNRTANQLVGLPLPYISGFPSVQFNLPAVVQNTGVELTINLVQFKSKNFEWSSAINGTIPNNKLVSFPGLSGSGYANSYVVGKSLFSQKVYHSTGVNPETGLYSFATKDGSGNPSYPQDLIVSKPVTQSFYGGFQNRFTYKGITLDFLIQYVKQLGRSYENAFVPAGFGNFNQPTAVLGRWNGSGDLTGVPRYGTEYGLVYNGYSYFTSSDGNITDASFLRLKNVLIAYQLPRKWTGKSHLQNARIYVQAQNLFTITSYLGLDPETAGSLSLPPIRMITAGIGVGL